MNAKQEKAESVLTFEGVELASSGEALDFTLGPGDLGLVGVQDQGVSLALLDVAGGLRPPDAGRVLFEERDWAEAPAAEAAARRAQISRVFEEGRAWVSNLNVLENITLSQRHHTHRAVEEIEAEALALAASFGLSDLPKSRPAWTAPDLLRRAQWVRALLGAPRLMLLANPTRGVEEHHIEPWLSRLHKAREAGTAVLWVTREAACWNKESIRPSWRLKLSAAKGE